MSRRPVNILCLLPGFCFLLCRCVQTYVSPYVSPVTGYLVVEGYMSGNIHSLSNSNETAIGYVSAGTIQQERIFIKRSQLSSWLYIYECQQPDKLVQDNPDSLLYYFNYWGYTPIQEVKPGVYSANYPECIDCTWQGGITTKPSFWTN
jgi:hypothetical protein